MIKSDHGSPNVSRAKLMGQSERLCCVCFIVKWLPRLPLPAFDGVSTEGQASSISEISNISAFTCWSKTSIVYSLANCKQYCSHGVRFIFGHEFKRDGRGGIHDASQHTCETSRRETDGRHECRPYHVS